MELGMIMITRVIAVMVMTMITITITMTTTVTIRMMTIMMLKTTLPRVASKIIMITAMTTCNDNDGDDDNLIS